MTPQAGRTELGVVQGRGRRAGSRARKQGIVGEQSRVNVESEQWERVVACSSHCERELTRATRLGGGGSHGDVQSSLDVLYR